ncbi:MAG: chromophore lyase CpcT/CpeT [Cyanobacteria bacterium J06598_1]
MIYSPLTTLAGYLAGEFENQAQAADEPAWYVRLRLWHRLVPSLSDEHLYTFFLEQMTVGAGKPPYRQRILQLREMPNTAAGTSGELRGEYFALSDPLKFRGAGTHPSMLNALSAKDLVSLPNSEAHIKYQTLPDGGYKFQSALPEGKLCSFEYGGQQRYVYLGFDVFANPLASGLGSGASGSDRIELLIYDKGIAPDTGRGLWGALMGPFKMVKHEAYATAVL